MVTGGACHPNISGKTSPLFTILRTCMALRFYTLRMYRPFKSLPSIYLSFKVLLAQLQPTHGVTPQALLPVKWTPGSAVQGPACEPTSYPPGGSTPPGFKAFRKRELFQADKGRSRVQNEVSLSQNKWKPTNPKHIQNQFKQNITEYTGTNIPYASFLHGHNSQPCSSFLSFH